MKRPPESGGGPSQAFAEPIAIVAYSGVFPGARTLEDFWRIIERGEDTCRPAPRGRWILDPKKIQASGGPDRVLTDRACFIEDFQLDTAGLELSSELLKALDPSFHLLLEAGRNAFRAAHTTELNRRRVGVIVGNIALPTSGSSALCEQVLQPLFDQQTNGTRARRPELGLSALNHHVCGLPAGVLAQALGLGGGTVALDAACASSLYAVKLACDELLAGRADAMLAGGLSRPDSLYTQMGFSQLRALAPSGRCAPFDAAGCGLIVGEGAGVVMLKRLSDALRDGDEIHAVVRGAGLSNDLDGNLLSPSSEGQLRALRQAYAQAGWTPDMVDLIECHATGTPVGDAVEFASLTQLWQGAKWRPGQCALGAVKANIGHLLTAAGSAGLIKVLLALRHRTLPPVANFRQPSAKIPLAGSPFEILSEARPWEPRDERTPRCAAINGFGFGGINAHLLIEEWLPQPNKRRARAARPTPAVAIVGLAATVGPWKTLQDFQTRLLGSGPEMVPAPRTHWRRVAADALLGLAGLQHVSGQTDGRSPINTPLQWGDARAESHANRFSGLPVVTETAEAVINSPRGPNTLLKQGVNETSGSAGVPQLFPGFYLDDLAIPVNRYRIPPKELAELLPQQALMLEVARAALADAPPQELEPARTGVFIGLGLDARTTDFHFRWATLARELGDENLAEGVNPALTADRTVGALAGTNASRIAKEFHFGGPSFTISSEDCSGTRALEIAVRALQRGEIDRALAGAVDITGDLRALLARDTLGEFSREATPRPFDSQADGPVPGEGAVALVLKRLDDARRDGDRVYAVIRGIGSASDGKAGAEHFPATGYREALQRAYFEADLEPASIGLLETSGSARPVNDRREAQILTEFFSGKKRMTPCHLSSAAADAGHAGAAAGLVSVVKASLALHRQTIPALRGLRQPVPEISGGLKAPMFPQHWVRDRADGPRRAGVSAVSMDGNCLHVVLEAEECAAGFQPAVSRISNPQAPVAHSTPYRLEVGDTAGWKPAVQGEGLFVLRAVDETGLLRQVEHLRSLAAQSDGEAINNLARHWWQQSGKSVGEHSLALVAQDSAQLLRLLDAATAAVRKGERVAITASAGADRDRLFYSPPTLGARGEIAFVFPGAGNWFPEMGRELALLWPEILRAQDRENERLAGQLCASEIWNTGGVLPSGADQRAMICSQVALGTFLSDLALRFGIRPCAAIGYSLGESTSLFALRAWTARDDMLDRVSRSTLFARDLTGEPAQLRRAWGLPKGAPVRWLAGLVDRPAEAVRAAIGERRRVYLLIINTPNECVIGGDAAEVEAVVAQLKCHWHPIEGVSTVHCELLRPVEKPYRELHLFDTRAPEGIRFYSGGWGRSYVPDRDTAANAIVAQASACIDFPRVIRAAYADGIRTFLELGPGNSCSRIISQILAGQPHVARSLCASAQEPLLGVLRVLGQLAAEGVTLDLSLLYGGTNDLTDVPIAEETPETKCVRIPITGAPFAPVRQESRKPKAEINDLVAADARRLQFKPDQSLLTSAAAVTESAPTPDPFEAEFYQAMAQSQAATLSAHQAYLDFSQRMFESLSHAVAEQLGGISFSTAGTPSPQPSPPMGAREPYSPLPLGGEGQGEGDAGVCSSALDRKACLEFARGSVAKVLGPDFAPVDHFPTRVRLPDEPLMLVDRILEIHGEARSMTQGRVVTEHDIHPGAWYLDCGRIPTCIAVEAGQADLFLSGYLGIDFITKGLSVYRLLDAKVRFHRSLPGPGEVIHYDIHIDHFFQQGGTWLFRFRFESTVNGEPLLTMSDGCAGFFSESELAGGKGIVRTTIDLQPMPGKRPEDWQDLVPLNAESYTAAQLDALRAGDLAACFGPQFANLPLRRPLTLPAGRMKLVHRISQLEPTGGRFGLGLIRGEADIHPKDWFLTCHFVDDRVMPGTLMFECCLHTLRVLLLRMGWVAEADAVALEPVPGVQSQLKCRGQVLETTKVVTYKVSLKEIGFRPEPYVIADALMYADGKAIVEITNMSLRYDGATREMFQQIWSGARCPAAKRVLYDRDRILAFAIGKPSEAFGTPYRVFDDQRRIARLPGPPYQFLDRITDVQGEPFKMVPGGSAVAEYDIPPKEWYFAANRQGDMPFAVLLEIALQPCGWLAAYVGNALTSEVDLSFRNLGGTARQMVPVWPDTGTLTIRVKMTRASSSAGMIIQWFDYEVHAAAGLVYKGDTYFGFFPKAALAKQEGLQGAKLYHPSDAELARSRSLAYPIEPPFADTQLRMVEQITHFIPDGGPHGLGFIRGTKPVVADEWFFKAHFYQDPVVPGSLGLESFLQLLKYVAAQRWGNAEGTRWEAVAIGQPHEWVYRGQVIPADRLVTVEAMVTAVDDEAKMLTADGFLSVDGRIIYGMKHFTVRQQPAT